MGGTSSGRHAYASTYTTDALRAIDVRVWKRKGLLTPGRRFRWFWFHNGKPTSSISVSAEERKIVLEYRHRRFGQDWETRTSKVFLAWTDCHLGGERAWFMCPSRGCGRRVAILYGGAQFACRHCHQLAYSSQRVTAETRSVHLADKIRAKLQWRPGIAYGKGPKPKGMHWRTFDRLTNEYDKHVQAALTEMAAKLNMHGRSVDDHL